MSGQDKRCPVFAVLCAHLSIIRSALGVHAYTTSCVANGINPRRALSQILFRKLLDSPISTLTFSLISFMLMVFGCKKFLPASCLVPELLFFLLKLCLKWPCHFLGSFKLT